MLKIMKYRSIGNTELLVSEIGFGTIPLLSGYVPVLPDYFSLDEETAIKVMIHAFNLGCNLFDTAIVPEYGDAEIKVGKFAESIGRENIIISDKARFYSGEEMYNAVYVSCENLGSHVDIYFVHQVDEKNQEQAFGKGGAVEALCELKMEGKMRFAGIASHYYEVLLRGAKDKRVDVLQGSGNILERGMLDRIEEEKLFREKGFILNKVYAAGILPSFFPVDTLISGVLSYPISSAIIGIGNVEQAIEAMEREFEYYRRPEFSQVISRLERDFMPIHCDRCQRCRCEYGIEIHLIFRQFNYFFLGKNYWALRKLDLGIRESAELCKKCIKISCMKSCPKALNIPYHVQKINELVGIHIRNSVI